MEYRKHGTRDPPTSDKSRKRYMQKDTKEIDKKSNAKVGGSDIIPVFLLWLIDVTCCIFHEIGKTARFHQVIGGFCDIPEDVGMCRTSSLRDGFIPQAGAYVEFLRCAGSQEPCDDEIHF
jgi:hypothetical protein